MAMVQGRSDHSASAEEIAELQGNGVTPEQCRRLVALRERVRHGGCDDGPRDPAADEAFARRLAFVRWLVQRGHLGEFDVPGNPA
jgi:hypothetical protein